MGIVAAKQAFTLDHRDGVDHPGRLAGLTCQALYRLLEIAGDRHPAEIWTPRGPLARTATKKELAETLYGLLDPAAEGTPSPAASDRESHR